MAKRPTFLCRQCKKPRPPVVGTSITNNTCLRCKLVHNKVMLLKLFKAMMEQPDMRQLNKNLNEWYPSERS